mmetsp:Transcript_64704/g.75938  ORF Transcript_64704/g.75938 Transcript_64704/m.75938 type:complete len:98 (-) Transcript_64704:3-296(-)
MWLPDVRVQKRRKLKPVTRVVVVLVGVTIRGQHNQIIKTVAITITEKSNIKKVEGLTQTEEFLIPSMKVHNISLFGGVATSISLLVLLRILYCKLLD